MNIEDANQMRTFILLSDYLGNNNDAPLMEEAPPPSEPEGASSLIIISDLNDLVTRMRSFMETSSGDYALGVEMGMQRAADMIENLVKRHTEGNNLG